MIVASAVVVGRGARADFRRLRLDTRAAYAIDVRTSSMLAYARMSSRWLLSSEALQRRVLWEIRQARTPLTARAEPRASTALAPEVVEGVATIRVEGTLTPKPDLCAEYYGEANTTYPEIRAALASAMNDERVSEIVWQINSPGGSTDGFFELLTEISEARAELKSLGKTMRVVAGEAQSAAYGIAAAAGPITATSSTAAFGSVGVACSYFVQGGMCGEVVDLTNTQSRDKRPDLKTPEGREVVMRHLDEYADEFMGAIAAGRGVTPEHVAEKFGRGASMLAKNALALGLINDIAPRPAATYARTLTHAHTSGTVPDCMATPSPAPEASSAPEAAAPAPLDIPVTVDLSGLDPEERAELAKFRAERDARASADRRGLVTELVALGAETPATAWRDGAPVARLAAEDLDDLRARVSALRSAKGPAAAAAVSPPASGAGTGEEALTDFERADAAKIKDPTARARFVAGRLARKQKAMNDHV
jgi:ClpP class serine protease